MTRAGGGAGRSSAQSARPRNTAASPRSPRKVRYAIVVRNEQDHLSVPPARIKRIARLVLAAEEVAQATISVALIDNRAIHRLNRRHLNHDYETDVLSFLFESEPSADRPAPRLPRGQGRRIDGEIVISAEMALHSAPRFGSTPAREFALYLVHGLLHLCGYDDGADSERRLMRKRERTILKLLGE